jgi:hypothetical protein
MHERSEQSGVVADRSTGRGGEERSSSLLLRSRRLRADRLGRLPVRPTDHSAPTTGPALEADRGPAQSAQRDVLAARAEIAPRRVSDSRPAPLTRHHVDSLRVALGITQGCAIALGLAMGVQ